MKKADGLKNSKVHIEAEFYDWLLEPLSEDAQKELTRILDILYYRCKEESKSDFVEMIHRIAKSDNN